MKSKIIISFIFVLVLSTFCLAQSSSGGKNKYKLLATKKTSTMQKEIDEWAAKGYRVTASSPSDDSELVVIMQLDNLWKKPFSYKLVSTTKTSTMQKEINSWSAKGYRVALGTFQHKNRVGADEITVIMEKAPRPMNALYEYKLLATRQTSTLEDEVELSENFGFLVVGMASRGEHLVLMERINYKQPR